jgi:hypothetical protein
MSSLNTWGYSEFDVLYNLNYLDEKLYAYADFSWLSRHTYHVFGKYNNKGQYMAQRVYICTNLNSPFAMQNCDQLEDYKINKVLMQNSSSFALKSQVESKEEEIMFLVGNNLLQDSIDKDRVSSNRGDYMFVGEDMLQTKTCGPILSPNIIHFHYFGNLVCLHDVHDRLQATSTPRTAFRQEGKDDEDMTSMHMTMLGESQRGQVDQQGHQMEKETQSLSDSSCQCGIKFESTSEFMSSHE